MSKFSVIIAGGRDFSLRLGDANKIRFYTSNHFDYIKLTGDLEFVSGCANGADEIPFLFKKWYGIPVAEFPADWENTSVEGAVIRYRKGGKAYNALAGHMRNQKMSDYAHALIAFWNGRSKGTKDMIDRATDGGLKVRVIRY